MLVSSHTRDARSAQRTPVYYFHRVSLVLFELLVKYVKQNKPVTQQSFLSVRAVVPSSKPLG